MPASAVMCLLSSTHAFKLNDLQRFWFWKIVWAFSQPEQNRAISLVRTREGQSSTHTLLLWSCAVITQAECGLALFCRNKQRDKTLSGWQDMLFQNLYVPFTINGAFTDVPITHAMDTNTTPYHHRGWLLNFALDGPFPLLRRGHNIHDFQKQ